MKNINLTPDSNQNILAMIRFLIFSALILFPLFAQSQNVGIGTTTPQGELHISRLYQYQGVTFNGTGLDDINVDVTGYNGTIERTYIVKVSSDGTTVIDKFDWSDDNGSTWTTDVDMSESPISLSYGIEVYWDNDSGHTYNDQWSWTIDASYPDGLIVKNAQVGIGTTTLSERLTVNGAVTLGNSTGTTAGSIRWNENTQDFEGYNGTDWLSLTKSNSPWGIVEPVKTYENAALPASDGAANDYFGYSVSISGIDAIIGAYGNDDNGSESGSAYIFCRNDIGWIEQTKLTASDGEAEDWFGSSVSISGNYAIVGAHGVDDNGSKSGSAYIYYRSDTGWTEQAKLTASDGAYEDHFGGSVSISGDYAIIGAVDDDDNGYESGSAYIFYRSGSSWTEQAKLTASDAQVSDWFGGSVSISGDYAIVGAPGVDDNGNNSGSAYIFHRSGSSWVQQTKLTASDAAEGDYFGYSVSISGDYAIIGAFKDDDNGTDSGSAYIFYRSGSNWTQQAKLTASNAAEFDHFGCSVSISGDYAIIGAHGDDDNGSDSGAAYIFEH